jgi:hypothetical protein
LADHAGATINDVQTWRDEALMLNLVSFGPAEHRLFAQAGFNGLHALLGAELPDFRGRIAEAATGLNAQPPTDLMVETWWEQARTLDAA